MADVRYNIVRDEGEPVSATAFYKGKVYVAAPSHPNFDGIVQALEEGTVKKPKDVVDLFDTASALAKGFTSARNLTRRIVGKDDLRDVAEKIKVTRNGRVIFDGEEVHGAISDTVLAYFRQGHQDFLPLIRFLDRVLKNPFEHSRENLYEWMKHLSFSIDDDGLIHAYKAVDVLTEEVWDTANVLVGYDMYGEEIWEAVDRVVGEERRLVSRTPGSGYVNGVRVEGRLANDPGDVVEMDRDQVTWNPAVPCSAGLHVGTVDYARGFRGRNGVLIEVAIDPADVVSVPTDSSGEKMRVCKYEVVREVREGEILSTLDASRVPVDV